MGLLKRNDITTHYKSHREGTYGSLCPVYTWRDFLSSLNRFGPRYKVTFLDQKQQQGQQHQYHQKQKQEQQQDKNDNNNIATTSEQLG